MSLSLSRIFKFRGLNFQVLLWARGKSLYEVRKFLGRPNPEKFEEIKEERKNSLLDEKIDIFSKVEDIFSCLVDLSFSPRKEEGPVSGLTPGNKKRAGNPR